MLRSSQQRFIRAQNDGQHGAAVTLDTMPALQGFILLMPKRCKLEDHGSAVTLDTMPALQGFILFKLSS